MCISYKEMPCSKGGRRAEFKKTPQSRERDPSYLVMVYSDGGAYLPMKHVLRLTPQNFIVSNLEDWACFGEDAEVRSVT